MKRTAFALVLLAGCAKATADPAAKGSLTPSNAVPMPAALAAMEGNHEELLEKINTLQKRVDDLEKRFVSKAQLKYELEHLSQ